MWQFEILFYFVLSREVSQRQPYDLTHDRYIFKINNVRTLLLPHMYLWNNLKESVKHQRQILIHC